MTVSYEVIERLTRYRAILRRLKSVGLERIFSDNLGDAASVSASQVRKDFQTFGIRGVRRGGYGIDSLMERLDELLGGGEAMSVVVVGCGHIGSALLRTYAVARDNVSVVAGFDIDPELIDPAHAPPILDSRELPSFLRQHGITVVILAVPERAVTGVLEQLKDTGIRGILNFAPVQLRDTDGWVVHNIDIRIEIEKLFHFIRFSDMRENDAGINEPNKIESSENDNQ